MDTKKALTPLERRFVQELLKDGNRAAAAERAGCKGTINTFKKLGYQMIMKPHVKQAYDELLAKTLDKAVITRETFVNEIQATIMEARVAGKYEAAFKGYSQLGELLGLLGVNKNNNNNNNTGSGKTKISDNNNDGANEPNQAFNQGDEDIDVNDDLSKFLKLVGKKELEKVN
jgi:hypothetical protein